MQKKQRAYIELHIAVMLYGFTAIFGDLISISAISLVWWRAGMTSLSLIYFRKIFTELRKLKPSQIFIFVKIGIIIGVHWVCFYGSIKLANASVALICMSTLSVFTAFLEPFFVKTRLQITDILFASGMMAAMLLIVQSLDYSMHQGIYLGILASFLLALFAVMNKKNINVTDPVTITFIEMFSAWTLLSFLLPWMLMDPKISFLPSNQDWIYLIILSVLCTTFAFLLNIRALRYISAFASNFVFNLEPVYGIALAILILKEQQELGREFYFGVLLITVLVFIYPLVKRALQK